MMTARPALAKVSVVTVHPGAKGGCAKGCGAKTRGRTIVVRTVAGAYTFHPRCAPVWAQAEVGYTPEWDRLETR